MGLCVVCGDESFNLGDQVPGANGERATDLSLGENGEPAFDLVQPRRVGWRVMNVEARSRRKPRPQPHRSKTFKLSTDPAFVDKVRDIVGLYLNHPDNAVVLCVDEKTQIQALERTQPVLPLGLGYTEGVTHDYIRHGTTTLFAALDIANGQIIAQRRQRHRHQEFLGFLKHVDAAIPVSLDAHLVIDNYATHKHPKVYAEEREHPADRAFGKPGLGGGGANRPAPAFCRLVLQNGAQQAGDALFVVRPRPAGTGFAIEADKALCEPLFRQWRTVGLLTPRRWPIEAFASPSAEARMICARRTREWGADWDRVSRESSSRSASLSVSARS